MTEKPKSLSLPLLITRSLVIYPTNQQLIEAGREFSINAINLSRNKTDSLIFITSQIKAECENPTEADLFHVGTLCRIISCYHNTFFFPFVNFIVYICFIIT